MSRWFSWRRACGVALALSLGTSVATAQIQLPGGGADPCEQTPKLRAQGDRAGARRSAEACLDLIESEIESEITQHILERVGDWKRTRLEQNEALGMRNATFEYRKGETRVRGNLMGGGGGRGLGGALNSFARMGMMGAGGRELSVADVPARIMPNGQFVISFEDGTTLTFESSQFKTPDAALEGFGDLIDAFPVAKMRDALKGSAR